MPIPAYSNAGNPENRNLPGRVLLYYITDRRQFPGTDAEQRRAVLRWIGRAARAGVDYIQVRERDLSAHDMELLAKEAVEVLHATNPATRLLVNSRVDIALAAGADGVHLRGDDPPASEARAIAAARPGFLVAVSCHTVADVRSAWSHGADFAVFGPVFEKNGITGTFVEGLKKACSAVPGFVLALGGVTAENARSCIEVGAAGVAGIRMFQGDVLSSALRELKR